MFYNTFRHGCALAASLADGGWKPPRLVDDTSCRSCIAPRRRHESVAFSAFFAVLSCTLKTEYSVVLVGARYKVPVFFWDIVPVRGSPWDGSPVLSGTILPLFPQAGVHGPPSLASSPSNLPLHSPLTGTCQHVNVSTSWRLFVFFVPQIQIAA